MYRKLQHNFDVIQYLLKDTSLEQLQWRKDQASWSLGEIICHLRDVESWHAGIQLTRGVSRVEPVLPRLEPAEVFSAERAYSLADYWSAFEQYAGYRRQTLALFLQIEPGRWQRQVNHRLFGSLTLAELVGHIDSYDRAYIYQMETIIHEMPLNPLMARAVEEIEAYHRRYQPYLAGVASILDIGVGPGLALRYLMLQHPEISFAGVDVRDLRLPEIQAPLQLYDGRTLPFPAGRFDLALLFYVLHHCQEPARVLAEAVRVTRQTLLIIEEFDRPGADETSLDLTERQSHRALGLPPDLPYQLFDKTGFEAMLKAHHLVELAQQPLPSRTTRPVQKYLYVLGVRRRRGG
jgi:SAM-dependent methyltransferase